MKVSAVGWRRFWVGVGWFGVALLIYLWLTPIPPEIPIEQGDKVGHVAAFAVLMLWWAQLYFSKTRWWIAAALLALGIGLEFVQEQTGYRNFEYADMVADLGGIALGILLAPPRLPNWFLLSKRWFARPD
ncbi:MAG: VanZ family protein [Proteobacteria bacterium]|nr:MAG: VanZ family protein [Pseudomonadota bacterium]